MKKITLISTILVLLNVVPVFNKTWASPIAYVTRIEGRLTTAPTRIAEKQTTELTNIQNTANTMITDRITALNTLLSKLQSDTRLSSDEKTTLTGNINTMIANLQALKTKIDADTDVTTARADRKSIVTSYHVFVTFDPQTRLLTIIDNLQTTTTTIANLVPQLQTLSSSLKSAGKDTSAIDTAITDINTQVTAINTLLSNDKTTLGSVVLTNNTYQTTFVQIRQDLAKVRADLATIHQDMMTIRNAVHALFPTGKITPTPTSAAPTATPTP